MVEANDAEAVGASPAVACGAAVEAGGVVADFDDEVGGFAIKVGGEGAEVDVGGEEVAEELAAFEAFPEALLGG